VPALTHLSRDARPANRHTPVYLCPRALLPTALMARTPGALPTSPSLGARALFALYTQPQPLHTNCWPRVPPCARQQNAIACIPTFIQARATGNAERNQHRHPETPEQRSGGVGDRMQSAVPGTDVRVTSRVSGHCSLLAPRDRERERTPRLSSRLRGGGPNRLSRTSAACIQSAHPIRHGQSPHPPTRT
jgi:hypothetical protein